MSFLDHDQIVPVRASGLLVMRIALMVIAAAVVALSILIVVAFSSIQQSRVDNIRTSCADQNQRHDFALSVTNQLLARPAVKPVRQLTPRQQAAQKAAVRTWVNALVPERDCGALVRRSVH